MCHLSDGCVVPVMRPYLPPVEVVERDEERGPERGHGGGEGDGDVPEENHVWRGRSGGRCPGGEQAYRAAEGRRDGLTGSTWVSQPLPGASAAASPETESACCCSIGEEAFTAARKLQHCRGDAARVTSGSTTVTNNRLTGWVSESLDNRLITLVLFSTLVLSRKPD